MPHDEGPNGIVRGETPATPAASQDPAPQAQFTETPAARDGDEGDGLAARIKRAFAVRVELDAAQREATSLETMRERAVALLGEAAWNAGAVPAAASGVAEQVRRLDGEAGTNDERAAEIEALLARHDATAGAEESEANEALAAAQAAYDDAEKLRDEARAALRTAEDSIAALRAKSDTADAAARAARAEADGLGVGNLTAEERIRREAELDAARIESEREAAGAREKAAAQEREIPALRETLDAAERLLSERAAERDRVDVALTEKRERHSGARAELDGALAEVRTRTDRLRVDRARLLAAIGSAAAIARPAHPTLDGLYAELGTLEGRLAGARTRAARLESESVHLRTLRIAVLSGGAILLLVLLLLLFVYALG